MNEFEDLITTVKNDLMPSLGVTEPAAIAYAAAVARNAVGGNVLSVKVTLNSGIYKNSFTCAVPNTEGYGCALAAALGAIAGDADKKLMALGAVTEKDAMAARQLIADGRIKVELGEISTDIFIHATVLTDRGRGETLIRHNHTNITWIKANGIILYECDSVKASYESNLPLSSYTLRQLFDYASSAEPSQLSFLREAVAMDMRLFECGRNSGLIPLTLARAESTDSLIARNRALLLTCGAIEARVRGVSAPAMAITGSGSHGILCMLPIHAAAQAESIADITELRAILLSCLITMHIKALSGRLSASCGCVIAGGTGAAMGLTLLYGGGYDEAIDALCTMAASVTGMICHGGNTGCVIKAMTGVEMAFNACKLAMNGCGAENIHGILDADPDRITQNMGYIAKGMNNIEKYIIDILRNKE